MNKRLLVISFLCLFLACNKDEDPTPGEETGSIFATVRFNGQIIEGVALTTEPETNSATTDITGSAIITDVPIGGYKVNATHPNIGTGSASVTVVANTATDVFINLIGGLFEAPTVNIQTPSNGEQFNTGDEVQFFAAVNDSKDNPQDLSIEWSSDINGIISTKEADSFGAVRFSTSTLSEGDHTISIKVVDSDNLEATAEVNLTVKRLPNMVTLAPITISSNGLELSWSTSDEATFNTYKLLRSKQSNGPFDVIGVISDINNTTFVDTDVSFGIRYYYQIAVVIENGDESKSNIESNLFEGENIDLGVNIVRMLIDKTRPYIYALDQINNSLLFINKTDKIVEKSIFVGSSPTDFDISLDNKKMYVANLGSTQIAVVDLEQQAKVDDLFVDTQAGSWDGNPYSIVYLKGGYLAYTSEDQWNNIKIVDATNGAYVSHAGSIHTPFLNSNPEQNIVYALDGGDVIRFNFNDGELSEVDETSSSSGYSRKIVVSRDGKYIFKGRLKFLANNLSSNLGTFGESIFASNLDGTIAIGEENIWNALDFSIIRPLPVASKLMELDTDNASLYVYDNNTSKIYVIQIN